jgi:hypothetical protein
MSDMASYRGEVILFKAADVSAEVGYLETHQQCLQGKRIG